MCQAVTVRFPNYTHFGIRLRIGRRRTGAGVAVLSAGAPNVAFDCQYKRKTEALF